MVRGILRACASPTGLKVLLFLGVVAGAATRIFVACDDNVRYELVTDCTTDGVLYAECGDAGTSYTCQSDSLPSDSDPTLSCTSSHRQANGDTEFCCASTAVLGSTCTSDSLLSCQSNETGYSCSGTDSPDKIDPTLECVSSIGANGSTTYCCSHESGGSTGCIVDADAGCSGGSTGYECPASATPATDDPSLKCSGSSVQSGTTLLYCCTH